LAFLFLVLSILSSLFGSGTAFAQAGTPSQVKSDSLPVHSDMSITSEVVTTLKKGDRVIVRFRIGVSELEWCKIAESTQGDSLGWVMCSSLLLKPPAAESAKPAEQGQSGSSSAEVISGSAGKQIPGAPRNGSFITAFEREALKPVRKNSHVSYNLDPRAERFYVYVPAGYTGGSAYGLVVFIDPIDDITEPPNGWAGVLDARKLLFIAPENAGNKQYENRRLGLGVLAAQGMMKHYEIDPQRVYISGFSGGARMAGFLGFFQSDVFRGTIQNCGADFYQHVPQVDATTQVDTAGYPYGFFEATAEEVRGARTVRFVLITGSRDFRRGNILDIYNGGFAKAGFQAKLFDVPGMEHDTADSTTLNEAFDFLEAGP
jgi:hypothetical protein